MTEKIFYVYILLIALFLPALSYAEVAIIMKDGVIFHWDNYKDYGDRYCLSAYGGSFCISKSDVKEIKEGDNLPEERRLESKGEGIARYGDTVIRRILASQNEREQLSKLNLQLMELQSAPTKERLKIKGELLKDLAKYSQRPNIYKKEIKILNSLIEDMEGGKKEARQKTKIIETEDSPKIKSSSGAIDVKSGQFYPGAAGGIINPKTGDFYPESGGGYINPKTGEFMPKLGK